MGTFLIAFSIVLAVLLGVILIYLFVLVRPRGRNPQNRSLLCAYAHRGLHDATNPENSLAAFELACQKRVGIELDVQLSRDGRVMVFHDYSLTRMTGVEKQLCELDAAELQSLSLSGSDQTIPTLEEVLALIGGRVPILVELKGEDLNSSLCSRVAALLSAYEGAYCIESFNPWLIRSMKKHLPNAFYGQLYTNVCRDKRKKTILYMILTGMVLNVLARPDFIAYNQMDREALPVKLTTGFYRAPKFVWTVRTDAEMSRATELGECPIFENLN